MNLNKLAGFAAGPIGSTALGAVSLPLLSWYFAADDLGRISLLQTIGSLVLIALGLGMDQAYIREYHAERNRAALLKTVLTAPLVLLAAACCTAALLLTQISSWIFDIRSYRLGLLITVFCAALLLTRYLSVVLRMEERAWAFSFSQITPKILMLAFVGFFAFTQNRSHTLNLAAAFACSQLLTAVLLAWQAKDTLKQAAAARFDRDLSRRCLHYGTPLALGGLAYWGLVSADRFLLKHYSGLEELGVYALAAGFGAAALIVQSIFSTVWAPTLFRWVQNQENLHRVAPIFRLMGGIVLAVWCAAGLVSPLLAWLLPPRYADVPFIVPALMLYPLLYTLTEVGGIGINVRRKTGLAALVSLAALSANLLLGSLLVPHFGARGAAASTSAAFWLFFLLKTEWSVRLWLPLPRRAVYAATLAALAVSCSYSLFGTPSEQVFFLLFWAAALAVLLWYFRRDLLSAKIRLQGRLKK